MSRIDKTIPPTATIVGVKVHALTNTQTVALIEKFIISRQPHQLVTVNPEFVVTAQNDDEFRQIINRAALALPDGIGLLKAAHFLGTTPLPERVAGSDLVLKLAELSHQKGYRIYFLGAWEGVAEKAIEKLKISYPNLKVGGYYAGSPAIEENEAIINRILPTRSDILLVAYGAPKQDKWIARNLERLQIPVCIGVGGSFDFIAGTAKRAPLWLQGLHLEWLHRLITQPWRWRRIWNAVPYFSWLVFWSRFKSKNIRTYALRLKGKDSDLAGFKNLRGLPSNLGLLVNCVSPKQKMRKTIVIAGGGSGGHTSAASAVVQFLQKKERERLKIVWITSHNGVEIEAAKGLQIESLKITTGKLHRNLNRRSIPDMLRVPVGIVQAWRLLGRLKPSLIFSTGGYVAVPVVIAAAIRRIPIIIHEQTLAVGLANLISAKFACKVLLSYKESQKFFPSQKCVVTGCPVRAEIFQGSAERAVDFFDLSLDLPTLYITGGAQGARAINRAVGLILPRLLEDFQVIHQCGSITTDFGFDYLKQIKATLPIRLQNRYKIVEYIIMEHIGDVFKLADIIISRSGAGTTAEIIALQKPCILIPYPYAIKNEQFLNAAMVEAHGLGQVIIEDDLSPEKLLEISLKTGYNIAKYHKPAVSNNNSAGLIYAEIIKII